MDENVLVERCNNFAVAGVWPRLQDMSPIAWLDNFSADDRNLACAVLGAVVHLSSEITNTLVEVAIRQLAPKITDPTESYAERRAQWLRFLLGVIVLYPDPDNNNPSKSGPLFVRKSRQLFGWFDHQMATHDDAARAVAQDAGQNILFVDDFAGTGDQFVECWTRARDLGNSSSMSFSELAREGRGKYFFCPAVSNYIADDEIRAKAPEVIMSAAHVLKPEWSLAHPQPVLVPTDMQSEIHDFVVDSSTRAGIHADDIWGYGDQGLALGFEHGVPDAVTSLLTWEENGWIPLMRRL